MERELLSREQIDGFVRQLARTPERLARAMAGKTLEQLQQRSAPEIWTASEILAHIRASDDIMTSRIYMLLARNMPPLVAFDERHWAAIAGYADREVQQSLWLLTLRRSEVVAVLQQLSPEAWQRGGHHEVRGTMTILDIVQDLAAHEKEHCSQLENLLAL